MFSPLAAHPHPSLRSTSSTNAPPPRTCGCKQIPSVWRFGLTSYFCRFVYFCVCVCVCLSVSQTSRNRKLGKNKKTKNINRCPVCNTATSCSEAVFRCLRMKCFLLRLFLGFRWIFGNFFFPVWFHWLVATLYTVNQRLYTVNNGYIHEIMVIHSK